MLDERAFARLAEEYAGRLYAVAYRMLGNRADAEDAVQRALTKCFAARASYSTRWAVSTWLYRALTNVCIDELRRRKPLAALEESDGAAGDGGGAGPAGGRAGRGADGAERAAAGADAAARIDLARALETVPREARVLLALHYVDGLSYQELAKVRGISVNTVKSQLARGKAILRRALDGGTP
jgi:RNA polymerase sigma-70 factor (ECF subfamily)